MNSITNEEVSTIIYKKDQLIKPFAQVFDDSWLIIVETDKSATWRDRFEELNKAEFESKYDKVFIYRYLKEEIITLNLSN